MVVLLIFLCLHLNVWYEMGACIPAGSSAERGDPAPVARSCARQDTEAVLQAGDAALWPGSYLLPPSRLDDFKGGFFLFFFFLNTRQSFPPSTPKTPIERAHFLSASILVAQQEEGTRWGDLYSS